ncbi:MAG: helix-turn-helix transcriptional regulator [Oscillospiraceae bacterium]|nr:helix-turn-helix transcriptional regulator [Oscillospiraceae bacterium]
MPTINMAATGRNINAMRRRAGMTVRDIQTAMGFNTPNAVYRWLRGDAMPTLDNLVILAAIFGVRMDDIIIVDRTNDSAISA